MSSRIDLGVQFLRSSMRGTGRALEAIDAAADPARVGEAIACLDRLSVDCRVVATILRDEQAPPRVRRKRAKREHAPARTPDPSADALAYATEAEAYAAAAEAPKPARRVRVRRAPADSPAVKIVVDTSSSLR